MQILLGFIKVMSVGTLAVKQMGPQANMLQKPGHTGGAKCQKKKLKCKEGIYVKYKVKQLTFNGFSKQSLQK